MRISALRGERFLKNRQSPRRENYQSPFYSTIRMFSSVCFLFSFFFLLSSERNMRTLQIYRKERKRRRCGKCKCNVKMQPAFSEISPIVILKREPLSREKLAPLKEHGPTYKTVLYSPALLSFFSSSPFSDWHTVRALISLGNSASDNNGSLNARARACFFTESESKRATSFRVTSFSFLVCVASFSLAPSFFLFSREKRKYFAYADLDRQKLPSLNKLSISE